MAELLARLRGALADRYAIERELGHGGTATVYHVPIGQSEIGRAHV